ncbi:tetratricopeptide repeat protein [Deinococcus arenicola]|uniref:Tetratricopeptide repeat protein n=1 Tax=Deinococcus arenicola TaxID=2994950 RepID=A0ABU4DL23_9DEIO|nr:tetratricopeptide repeat protein [Deinococcus sp. ZS9-10]MDV6373127.1 tetratricopeptide repeat protein [Deinococcus sp. ZS9-10]
MIDAETTWQQACTALAGGDYEAAYGVLDAALGELEDNKSGRPVAARLCLYMGSMHALYGDAATEQLGTALNDARTLSPAVKGEALYAALNAEFEARTLDEGVAPPDATVREATDPLARFHAICALSLLEEPQAALDVHLASGELPPHLRWRLRSWQADCQEGLGHTEDAINLYAEAAHLAAGLDRAVMLQEQAALLIQNGQPEEAKKVLDSARMLYNAVQRTPAANPAQIEDEGMTLATWHYLRAQALLQLDQPEAAFEMIREADRLERQHGASGYVVALLRGQILSHMGQQEEAIASFEAALKLAEDGDRPFANHELGVVLLDMDRPVEARDRLEVVLNEPDYPYLPEVLADIAECDYRLGRMPEAQLAAEQALAQGAVIPASLVLGSVALDYFQLDDALEHYERVVREAAPDSRDWITGHQMAADVMAQQGFPNPAAAIAHAQQALDHTPESDDWHGTLQDLLAKAQAMLGQQDGRMLN